MFTNIITTIIATIDLITIISIITIIHLTIIIIINIIIIILMMALPERGVVGLLPPPPRTYPSGLMGPR